MKHEVEFFNRQTTSFSFSECANNPVLVLAISSWVIIGLGHGAFYLKITTDPVELWAGPNSRSRVEKDYFDSRFSPFYRTNQIFIKPLKQDNVRSFQRFLMIQIDVKLLFR